MRTLMMLTLSVMMLAAMGCGDGWSFGGDKEKDVDTTSSASTKAHDEKDASPADTAEPAEDGKTQSEPAPAKAQSATDTPTVVIQTSKGAIVVELYASKAPVSVENFLRYADEGFYADTMFHRVIENFMIQGGGMEENMARKDTHAPIRNEADNGLKNERGTLAMARTGDPHSATSQFFINHRDNPALNHTAKTPTGWGYCVFGRVVDGMDVVDAIAKVPTTTRNGFRDVPVEPVIIKSVKRQGGK